MACCVDRTEALAQARRRTGRRRNLPHLDPPHRSIPHYHSCHRPLHHNSTHPTEGGQPLESCPASLRMGIGVASEQPTHSGFVAITATAMAAVARAVRSRGSLSGELAEAVLVPIRSRNATERTAIEKRMATVTGADCRMAAIRTLVQEELPSEECRISILWQLLWSVPFQPWLASTVTGSRLGRQMDKFRVDRMEWVGPCLHHSPCQPLPWDPASSQP